MGCMEAGVDGAPGSPTEALAAQDAVEDATRRVLEQNTRVIQELRAEIARLRAGR
jgi:hypothetical protein